MFVSTITQPTDAIPAITWVTYATVHLTLLLEWRNVIVLLLQEEYSEISIIYKERKSDLLMHRCARDSEPQGLGGRNLMTLAS